MRLFEFRQLPKSVGKLELHFFTDEEFEQEKWQTIKVNHFRHASTKDCWLADKTIFIPKQPIAIELFLLQSGEAILIRHEFTLTWMENKQMGGSPWTGPIVRPVEKRRPCTWVWLGGTHGNYKPFLQKVCATALDKLAESEEVLWQTWRAGDLKFC